MMKYEYKVLTFKTRGVMTSKYDEKEFESALNKYGAEGWQLISCTPLAVMRGETESFVCTFLRVVR